MTNETNVEETPSKIQNLKTKLKSLPWKQIVIGTVATAATVVVVKLATDAARPALELETSEETPDESPVTEDPKN